MTLAKLRNFQTKQATFVQNVKVQAFLWLLSPWTQTPTYSGTVTVPTSLVLAAPGLWEALGSRQMCLHSPSFWLKP